MNNDAQPTQDRRNGAFDRRMRERSPASDRRIESHGQSPGSDARAQDVPSPQAEPQMLFERS